MALARVVVERGRDDAADSAENRAIRLRLGHGRELLWPMSLPLSRLAELLLELERRS